MILCFTGTGNSRLVALELQRHIGGEVVMVCPVYSWGLPPVVNRFIRRSKIKGAHEAPHFLVCTCGDDVGRADDRWRKLVGRRGWSPRGAFSVTMPNTYVCMSGFDTDTPEVADAKVAAMPICHTALDELVEWLYDLGSAGRAAQPLLKGREHTILPGALILVYLMKHMGLGELRVSDRDGMEGFLLDVLA